MANTKIFRWMSQRYPLSIELIADEEMPRYDNLYLDITSIVQECCRRPIDSRHPVSEEEIWNKVFLSISQLVSRIKPEKLLLLVMDGVTPRAKANEQRHQRFGATKDAQQSSWDTALPGTTFSAKLTQQLRCFVAKKVSEEANWRGLQVILSGLDVPGEGKQKIMDHLRISRSLSGYNPNTRHCLYGVRDDFVLLALVSHETHFSLLCQESALEKYPRGYRLDAKRHFLLHLSIVRECIDLEFSAVSPLPFRYDLECILDDFVLLSVLVNNEFLPNLPHLGTYEESMAVIINIYKEILPISDGYLQNSGSVFLSRLLKVITKLATIVEKDAFETEHARSSGNEISFADLDLEGTKEVKPTSMTDHQAEIYCKVRDYLTGAAQSPFLRFPFVLTNEDRKFTNKLTKSLKLSTFTSFSQTHQMTEIELSSRSNFNADEMDAESNTPESRAKRDLKEEHQLILDEYATLEVISVAQREEQLAKEREEELKVAYERWKDDYYQKKMNIDRYEVKQMDHIVASYVIGIQWVIRYYFDGVPSWRWYYPYHYAPKPSDVKNVARFQDYFFNIETPFKPFEYLMYVLPNTGVNLLPTAYQSFMVDHYSPIIRFYPTYFQTDTSGKTPVLRIPFINASQLDEALKTKESLLTQEELELNISGQSYSFMYNANDPSAYETLLSEQPSKVKTCCTSESSYRLPSLHRKDLKRGLLPGTKTGKDQLYGFPSLKHLKLSDSAITKHNIRVFQNKSTDDSIVLSLKDNFSGMSITQVVSTLMYRQVYVGYPSLRKAIVVGVSDASLEYRLISDNKGAKFVVFERFNEQESERWNRKKLRLEAMYSKRYGLLTQGDFLLHVCLLSKVEKNADGSLVERYTSITDAYQTPAQTVVLNLPSFTPPVQAISNAAWSNFVISQSRDSQTVSSIQSDPSQSNSIEPNDSQSIKTQSTQEARHIEQTPTNSAWLSFAKSHSS